ncbi:MAG: hypothetical protein APR62_13385 [Smithella sp. SDB]|nr:MAG: hypothetical protein APR62_13385 [Smithella sp. SDB]
MKQKAIVILGMHRSGTSAFAGVLSMLGINFGSNLMPPAFDNEKGYFENIDIYNVNETILSSLGSSWDSLFALPSQWWLNTNLNIYKDEIRDILRQEFESSEIFGVKDPRLSWLFPLWREILDSLNIEYHIIIPVRNPLEVAMSLAKRNNFSLEKGTLLWTSYNLEAEQQTRKYPRLILSYNKLLECPKDVVKFIADKLKINYPWDSLTAMSDIDNFLEPTLRHHDFNFAIEEKRLLNYIFKLYKSLLDLSGFHDIALPSTHAIDDLAAEFINMRNYFYTFELQDEMKNTLKMKKQLEQIQQKIHSMENSFSWKITAPLRSVKTYFNRISKYHL